MFYTGIYRMCILMIGYCKTSILETEVDQMDALICVFADVPFTVFLPLQTLLPKPDRVMLVYA